MSTGGNVPAQGVQLPATPKRGPRGNIGEGTPGTRLKSAWRRARKEKESPFKGSLRSFVKKFSDGYLADDAKSWLMSKSGGTPEEKADRRRRRKERTSENRTAKLARKGKGKQKQQTKKAA